MKWANLLQPIRLNEKNSSIDKENIRSPFLRDVDKITFSFYFRTLQDKTQVQPLAKSSYIRTRLTHSMEVSTVGRSLGNIVGKEIIEKHQLQNKIKNYTLEFYDFGYIVQAAALAHDIGNPPFGHKGEDAISNFYKHFIDKLKNLFPKNKNILEQIINMNQNNFTHFDGNAQGFRIITNLAKEYLKEGLNLTCPVLATFCKYPNTHINPKYIGSIKIGVFDSEIEILQELKNTLKLVTNPDNILVRHPLTFLLEAADDICYLVADTCDAFITNTLEFNEVYELFYNLIFSEESLYHLKYNHLINIQKYYNESYNEYKNSSCNNLLQKEKARKIIESLASEVINLLTLASADTFLHYEENILKGTHNDQLLSALVIKNKEIDNNKNNKYSKIKVNTTSLSKHIEHIRNKARTKIYEDTEKISQEIKGTIAIEHILEEFGNILINLYSKHNITKYNLLHKLYLQDQLNTNNTLYTNLQIINDFIVKCTDKDIMEIYHNLRCI